MTARLASLLALGLLLSACCGTPENSAPLVKQKSDQGKLELTLVTTPQPPTRGLDSAVLTVTDPSGKPVAGLTVGLTPYMPAMGHGGSVQPTVTDKGNGVYDITNLYLYMPGEWQLIFQFSGPVTDSATLAITVD